MLGPLNMVVKLNTQKREKKGMRHPLNTSACSQKTATRNVET